MGKKDNQDVNKTPVVKKCGWPGKGKCPFRKNVVVCPYETTKNCLDPMNQAAERSK